MTFETKIVKKEAMITSNWSGGTTTQILIYPETADYAKRDFIWRISTARVEVEESTFTSLPGISRILMILDGNLKIDHEGHHSKLLDTFDTDYFKGDWITKSYGKVIDFNLMMKDGVSGELDAITISAKNSIEIMLDSKITNHKNLTSFFYSPFNNIDLLIKGKEFSLCPGEMFCINYDKENDQIKLINLNDKDITIAFGRVSY
jgi:uncharacterized protein